MRVHRWHCLPEKIKLSQRAQVAAEQATAAPRLRRELQHCGAALAQHHCLHWPPLVGLQRSRHRLQRVGRLLGHACKAKHLFPQLQAGRCSWGAIRQLIHHRKGWHRGGRVLHAALLRGWCCRGRLL